MGASRILFLANRLVRFGIHVATPTDENVRNAFRRLCDCRRDARKEKKSKTEPTVQAEKEPLDDPTFVVKIFIEDCGRMSPLNLFLMRKGCIDGARKGILR